MFFNLTWRNAKRSRSENLIYFLTMITAVAMFYIVLSLGQQDVIRFLSEIESDAVERLLTNLLPTVYLCALLFVFFLVVFANKYQLECRSRELGLYLMFGMTKIKLFIQIMTEGLITSFLLVFIRHNPDGVINLLLIGKPVGFFQIEKQILHVRIVQGGAFPVEADGLYDVLAVGQDVVCDSPGKQRVTLEYGQAVPYALTDTAFLGSFQPRLDFLNALGRLHGVHGVF